MQSFWWLLALVSQNSLESLHISMSVRYLVIIVYLFLVLMLKLLKEVVLFFLLLTVLMYLEIVLHNE